jgi:hypothetical protein
VFNEGDKMRKFLLGVIIGAAFIVYLNWGVPDYMFAAGNLTDVQNAYDFDMRKSRAGRPQ